jgi:hypothetical protein
MRRFLLRLWNAFRHARSEHELDREVSSHLGLIEDEYMRRGLSDEEAHRAARLALGGVEQTKELHVVDVRIYQGIHFRSADEVARRQGTRAADWAVSHFLRHPQ